MFKTNYNPDVLNCLANLSSDEVFTPPTLANKILDLLPNDLWNDKNTKFLDPGSKSGVFLREITKRLLSGLKKDFPNRQNRLDHILKNQVFGIATTELTSLLSRRSLYCTKTANNKYSITNKFNNEDGNIYFKSIKHSWKLGKCEYCDANKEVYERNKYLESYAYNFIHTKNLKEIYNMKFDVIIGNPPYQLSDGGAASSAIPIYHKFVNQAKKMNPRYLSMIIPSRWFTSGKGLDSFRAEMLNDKRMKILNDYFDASKCFPGVEIKGGVCYFLWDKTYNGPCTITSIDSSNKESNATRYLLEKNLDVFIRYNQAVPILNKVRAFKEKKFNELISSRKPFGLPTTFNKINKNKTKSQNIIIYANKNKGYIDENEIIKNNNWINKFKLFVPYAIGSGDSKSDIIKPILGVERTCCTETYLVFGPFDNKTQAENAIRYINTKFFHFLLTLKKNTQHATSKVYEYIPIQNFNEKWNDEKLFKKYGLSNDEINFIHDIINPQIIG